MADQNAQNLFNHTFKIVELYTNELNIYGDTGNSLVLKRRFELYGLKAEIINYNIGDILPNDPDIVVSGGGQDSGQINLYDDLLKNAPKLKLWAEDCVPMLVICGMYQLFGNYFMLADGKKLEGLGIFDMYTQAKSQRIIGNLITLSNRFGRLIGYENHSGQTFLNDKSSALSQSILLGEGNNTQDSSEGAIYNNTIGTYMHGPILPKNPKIANYLINCAVNRFMKKDVTIQSKKIDDIDKIAWYARNIRFTR